MGFIPVSFIVEVFLMVFAVVFLDYRYAGRIAGVCCTTLAVRLVTASQVYILESSGSMITVTAAYPATILEVWTLSLVVLWYLGLVSIFEELDRDFLGRRRAPAQ